MNQLNQELASIRTSIEVKEKELTHDGLTQDEEDKLIDEIIMLRIELKNRLKQTKEVKI